ncbi:MAG TPA: anti-sigma factor [Chthoniobacterales bacterium]|nr:anti-sigma factor [Chthoniobacterales bacterium]
MIDEQLQEQASLYVLGTLDPEEARAFEAQLDGNDELRRHVDELSETIAQLAHTVPPRAPSANLEARILAEIRETKTASVQSVSRAAWIPWAIAASLAIACAIAFADRQQLAKQLATVQKENADTDAQLAASAREVTEAQTQVARLAAQKERAEQQVVELQQREADARAQMATLAAARDESEQKLAQVEARRERVAESQEGNEPDLAANIQVATLSSKFSNAPEASAVLAWDSERQRGVLNTNKVPPSAADRDYQLWIVDARFANPIDAGVFRVEKSGSTRYVFKPKIRVELPSAFAVSVERRGGVPKAEGPIVLAGK